jgi:alginate O-acetyltransferase complex protein AlgI
MKFDSLIYLPFLIIAYFIYWNVKNNKNKNLILLIFSIFFYGYWNYKFLILIFFTIIFDYLLAILIRRQSNVQYKRLLLICGIIVPVSLLIYFKYTNFIFQIFQNFNNYNIVYDYNIILPLAISFYTFHSLSYIIDVYNSNIEPEKNIITYASFILFFPLLVAGPIERSNNLLIQLQKEKNYIINEHIIGLRLILWGLFKKIVIADNLSIFVDQVFNLENNYSNLTYIVSAIYFSFQIYFDFSGYSLIAIGSAKLFGFNILNNFNFPYFSISINDFWKKWHISLTSWFKDYIYIPLGGNRYGILRTISNIFIIFMISAIWHGANFTFIIWGLLHFIFNLTYFIKLNFNIPKLLRIFFVFISVSFAWIFFRSENLSNSIIYISRIINNQNKVNFLPNTFSYILLIFTIFAEYLLFNKHKEDNIFLLFKTSILRNIIYFIFFILIIFFSTSNNQFIYFNF